LKALLWAIAAFAYVLVTIVFVASFGSFLNVDGTNAGLVEKNQTNVYAIAVGCLALLAGAGPIVYSLAHLPFLYQELLAGTPRCGMDQWSSL
jgi:uncharacterized membrane protein YphA (DoxX/SURF4 family)